jgi:pimeloyl-ACP methyl ester carboxylesterase
MVKNRRIVAEVGTFTSADGTRLTYHQTGHGRPVLCIPGGPLQASAYMGDLGGLTQHRSLVLLDLRGTGSSAEPADPTTYRCDHLVDDIEALRQHLNLPEIDLLAHSAGAAIAILYATQYPSRINRLALITPSPRVVGLEVTDQDRRAVAEQRNTEPWFPDAFAAFSRIWSGTPTSADWTAIAPFTYGRWDKTAQAHKSAEATQRNNSAVPHYYADGALDPPTTRKSLTEFNKPVLFLTGEYDVGLPPRNAAEYAALFKDATLTVQPGAGHFPWLDDPAWFTRALA